MPLRLKFCGGLGAFRAMRFLSHRIAVVLAAGLLAAALTGCSLLKVNFGGHPMPARDLDLRIQTREFATAFSARVESTADAIGGRADLPDVRLGSIRWKLGATAAMKQSSLRTDPMLALVDAWTLCRQMRDYFAGTNGGAALGAATGSARKVSEQLEEEIATMARRVISASEFRNVSEFVESYCPAHPIHSLGFERDAVALRWLEQDAGANSRTVGNMPEAITDLSDRVSAFGQQIPLEVRWRVDLERAELEPLFADARTMSTNVGVALQSIPVLAENARLVSENARQLTKAAADLTQTIAPELARFDRRWESTLVALKTEREAVMEVLKAERIAVIATLDTQREALMRDFARERAEVAVVAEKLLKSSVAEAGQQAKSMIGMLLFYGVLILVVALGLPFASGYFVGRTVAKRKQTPPGSRDG